MADNRLKNIVIVGGGSAGWMTAAALSSMLTPDNVSIKLIESDKIGTVGVGEATIPDMLNFNAMLGINSPLQDYSMCAVAGVQNKFTLPDPNPRSVLSQIRYAYHIDATLYAKYLRSYAEKNGVKRIEGKVEDVRLDAESGNIASLQMEDKSIIEGDFFFDCTGFRALLTEKALNVPFSDWSHWLPCDTAQTVASERQGPLLPYTKATAKSAGWQWRIPTQHRTGNGHIYSSEYMKDNEAIDTLMEGLDSDPIGEPRKIRFKTGCRDSLWTKNCIAIGLSAGFLEPLESTSLFLIQQGVSRFITLFPTASFSDVVRDEYNKQMLKEFYQVRDFIILHYCATQRDDSPFWDYCRNMSIPDSLKHKIDLFNAAGRVFRYDDELFSKPSWIAVCLGQNIIPKATDPIVTSLPYKQVLHSLDSMHNAMVQAAQKMPTHEDFLQTYGAVV